VRTWTAADLDKMAANYNPANHEAPICIDHNESAGPINGGPAYGWVESLKREGDTLLAKFKQVAPGFIDAVKAGLFKKRSISVYPDGTLRHVAWLGAKPPAIKGLADFAFSDGGEVQTYSETLKGAHEMTIEELQTKLAAETKAREEAEAKAKAADESVATLKSENEKLAASFAEAEKKRKRDDIETFVNDGIEKAKILPAWKKAGLVEFMVGLDESTDTYQFSEGAQKQTRLDWFKSFVSNFAEHPLFKEMVKPENHKQDSTDDVLVSGIVKASGCAAK
jgi:hypothetical protein